MAFIWTRDEQGDWAAMPLSDDPVDILSLLPSAITPEMETAAGARDSAGRVRVLPTGVGISRRYVLVWGVRETVRINGLPLATGAHVLSDRDEVQVGARGPMYFSGEALARVEVVGDGERSVECVRCTLPIGPGAKVVRCPVCLVVYHEDADLNCWTGAPACKVCHTPTGLDAGFRWTPRDPWA